MKLAITTTEGDRSHVWPLEGSLIRIGRNRSNAVQIRSGTVSREHAEIYEQQGRVFLRDLNSRNGTWLNGIPVHKPVPVRIGDSIQLGRVSLLLTAAPAVRTDTQLLASDTSTIEIPASEVLGRFPGAGAAPGELIRQLEKAGRLLVQQRSLPHTCEAFLQAVEAAIPASRLLLLMRKGPEGDPVQVAARCRPERAAEPLLFSGEALRTAMERRSALVAVVNDPNKRPAKGAVASAGRGAPAVAVPLVHERQSLGILYADHEDPCFRFGPDRVQIMTLFANMAAARIANEGLLEAERGKARIAHEMGIAARIQRSLLPARLPAVEGYEIFARFVPCEQVGGDFYDVHPAPDGRVWLLLGDVAGKGICGAILMALCISTARVLYDTCAGPGALATRLNSFVAHHTDDENFATAVIGLLDPATGLLRYVNAGHPAPLVCGDGPTRRLESTSTMLGVLPDLEFEEARVTLPPGAQLAVFSDGVPEARTMERQFFGDRRVRDAVEKAARCSSIEEAARGIFGRVDEFLGGRPRKDDIALLLLRRGAPGGRES